MHRFLVAAPLFLSLAACGGGTSAAEHVTASCTTIASSLRHRAQSFEDDPESFLRSVRVEGHGTLPQLRHVRLCAQVLAPTEGARESVVQDFSVAVDEAHGLISLPESDTLSRPERVRRLRALLTRMADLVDGLLDR